MSHQATTLDTSRYHPYPVPFNPAMAPVPNGEDITKYAYDGTIPPSYSTFKTRNPDSVYHQTTVEKTGFVGMGTDSLLPTPDQGQCLKPNRDAR